MFHYRITSCCLGAVALLFAAAVLSAGSAEARFVPGLDQVSDCAPDVSHCRTGGSMTQTISARSRFARQRFCRARAARAPFPEDRPMIYAACLRRGG